MMTLFPTRCPVFLSKQVDYRAARAGIRGAARALVLVFSLFFSASLLAQDCADCTPYDETIKIFLNEAEKGNPLAMTRTALLFFIAGSQTKGESWLQKAMDAGEPGAMKMLADLYADGLDDYPKDRKRALDLYRQAATASAQAKDSGRYPPRYLLALKVSLNGILGEAAASGEEGAQDVQEAARLFAEAGLYPQLAGLLIDVVLFKAPLIAGLYPQLAGLLIRYPELDSFLDSLSPESLRELADELAFQADDDENETADRAAALRLLVRLYEEDGTGVHLATRRVRWERSLVFARYAEDDAAAARLEKKLQTAKLAKPARSRAASGWYSGNNVAFTLLDNGRFRYAYAFGVAGRGVQASLDGTWKEAAKGRICLTPSPSELVLFGRFDVEKALDAKLLMSEAMQLSMDSYSEEYAEKVFLSWKTGEHGKLPDDFSRFASAYGRSS